MKITMFAINPLFPDQVIGGSTKHLKNVAVRLGEMGHDVTILSTRRPDTDQPFRWHPRVEIRPTFHFKQPFPEPYATPTYHIANAIQDVSQAIAGADRFYMHDGEFLFPPAYHNIPTVVSLRDNVYAETMLGSYLFQGDALIAVSNYSRRLYLSTAGRFLTDLAERTITINNGIDFDIFKPTPLSAELRQIIGLNPAEHAIILHPHRPEPSKGLLQTIAVADELVHRHRITNLKVLAPRWFDTDASPDLVAYYRQIEHELAQRNLTDHFHFHGWIPQSRMPEYYSLGMVTLVLGHFVEAWGNTAYESMACGTPAIVSRVSANRDLLPDDMIAKVHFNDTKAAAKRAADIINNHRRTAPVVRAELQRRYAIDDQLSAYAGTILNARKLPPMRYRFSPLSPTTVYRLAPWCYEWSGGFYHDFLATHTAIPSLSKLLKQHPHGFTINQAATFKIAADQIDNWYRAGYLAVPHND